jgi:hypothetical protein
MTDNERLKSSDLFDFDKWTYNILREDVENNLFQKIFTFKKYRTRYWISAVRKGPYVEKRDMEILCYEIYDHREFSFETPNWILQSSYKKIKYWNNSQEPMDIIRHLRAKLDVEALPENLVFSSDDI